MHHNWFTYFLKRFSDRSLIFKRNPVKIEVSREAKSFPNELEKIDSRLENVLSSRGVSNSILEGTRTKLTSSRSKNECRTDKISESVGQKHVAEMSNSEGVLLLKGVHKQLIW